MSDELQRWSDIDFSILKNIGSPWISNETNQALSDVRKIKLEKTRKLLDELKKSRQIEAIEALEVKDDN